MTAPSLEAWGRGEKEIIWRICEQNVYLKQSFLVTQQNLPLTLSLLISFLMLFLPNLSFFISSKGPCIILPQPSLT